MADPAARPVGLALAALGIGGGVAALSIGGWGGGAWGARTVPLLASFTLVAGGAAIAFTPSPSPSAAAPPSAGEGEPVPGARDGAELRVAWLLALAVMYVLAIERLGYLLATTLASPAAFALFGARRPGPLALAAVLVPLALHLVFFRVLGVFPPLGRWFDLLDHLPL